MNGKFVISVVVMFIMLFVLGWLAHGILLADDYAKLTQLMRPMAEFQAKLPYLLLAHFLTALAFTWIYLKGKEEKPWFPQGLRYGIAVAVLMMIPFYLIYHALMPYPLDLAIKGMVYDTITVVLMGIVLAWINR